MILPQVTPLYAGLLALLYVVLTINVIRGRWRMRIGLGDGGEKQMQKLVRAHGNFSEYAPLVVVLLLLLELAQLSPQLLHALGGAFVVGRILHAIGIGRSAGTSAGRMIGTILTLTVLTTQAVLLLWLVLSGELG